MDLFLQHFGYLDAGTGSIIVQAVVGAVAGVGLFARRRIYPVFSKIGGLFSGKKSAEQPAPTQSGAKAKAKEKA